MTTAIEGHSRAAVEGEDYTGVRGTLTFEHNISD